MLYKWESNWHVRELARWVSHPDNEIRIDNERLQICVEIEDEGAFLYKFNRKENFDRFKKEQGL